ESFEDMDIKVLEDVPVDGADGEIETETKEEPDEQAEAPAAADSLSESSDPVRLYLKEMGNFQLLSREQEVEIAKRIEAGENEVEEEVLGSPIMLDFVIRVGERVEAGEADLRDVFEDAAETPEDPDEERGPEADERQLKKLMLATKKLTDLRTKIEVIEEILRNKPGPRRKPKLDKNLTRLNERVKKELRAMALSRRLMEAVIAEMRDVLQEYRIAHHTIAKYEEATGRSRTHLLKEAAEAEDRRHVLKINDVRENLLDIAARIRLAQKTIREVEKKAKNTGEEYARKLETIAAGQDKSRRAKKELTRAAPFASRSTWSRRSTNCSGSRACSCNGSAANPGPKKSRSRWRCRWTRSRRCSRSSRSRSRSKRPSATRRKVRSAILSRTSSRRRRSRLRFRAISASRRARCSPRSRRARSKSCACASASARRPTTRWRKSANNSPSPASVSGRSRPRRCANCARPADR